MQTLIELVSDAPSAQLAANLTLTGISMTVTNLTGTWPTPVSGISKFRFNFGPGTEECECTNISGATWTIKRAVNGISATHNSGDTIYLPFNHNTVAGLMSKGGGTFGGPVTHGTDYAMPTAATRPPVLTLVAGSGLAAGQYAYAVTNVDANGYESAPSPLASITVNASLGNSAAPTVSLASGGTLAAGTALKYIVLFENAIGGSTSVSMATAASVTPTTGFGTVQVLCPTGPTGTYRRVIYRSTDAGAHYFKVGVMAGNSASGLGATWTDTGYAAGTAAPVTDTSQAQAVGFSFVPLGPSGTVSRNIYRSKVGTSGPLYLQQSLANNTATTASNDTTVDASLGATVAPTAHVAANAEAHNGSITFTGPTKFRGDMEWLYVPPDWKGLRRYLDQSGSQLITVALHGASTMAGNETYDVLSTGPGAQIKRYLTGAQAIDGQTLPYTLGAEYCPSCWRVGNVNTTSGAPTPPFSAFDSSLTSNSPTVGTVTYPTAVIQAVHLGWHVCDVVVVRTDSGGASPYTSKWHQTFTVPANAPGGADLFYYDTTPGTWQYQYTPQGGATQGPFTVTNDTPTIGGSATGSTPGTAKVKRIHISANLPAGSTIQWGMQSGPLVCIVPGIAYYPSASQVGIGIAHLGWTNGAALSMYAFDRPYDSVTGLNMSANGPSDRCVLFGGVADPNLTGTPQTSYPYSTPPTPTAFAPSIVGTTNGSGGSTPSVSAPGFIYRYTFWGAGGESAPSVASAATGALSANSSVTITLPTDPLGNYANGYGKVSTTCTYSHTTHTYSTPAGTVTTLLVGEQVFLSGSSLSAGYYTVASVTASGATSASAGSTSFTIKNDPLMLASTDQTSITLYAPTRRTLSRLIYRSANSGSTWVLVGSVGDNLQTQFVDTSASTTTATLPTGPAAQPQLGAFGFPMAPHAYILECTWDDAVIVTSPSPNGSFMGQLNLTSGDIARAASYAALPSQADFQGTMARLILAIQAAHPDAAIILVTHYDQDIASDRMGDPAGFPATPMGIPATALPVQYAWAEELARQRGCAVLRLGRKWGRAPIRDGWVNQTGQHASDAGYQDIAAAAVRLMLDLDPK